jgi:hypothetical protein
VSGFTASSIFHPFPLLGIYRGRRSGTKRVLRTAVLGRESVLLGGEGILLGGEGVLLGGEGVLLSGEGILLGGEGVLLGTVLGDGSDRLGGVLSLKGCFSRRSCNGEILLGNPLWWGRQGRIVGKRDARWLGALGEHPVHVERSIVV